MPKIITKYSFYASCLIFAVLDLFALNIAFGSSVLIKSFFATDVSFSAYAHLSSFSLIFIPIAIALGLYPGYYMSEAQKLKLACWSLGITYLFVLFLQFATKHELDYSRFVFFFSLLVSVPLLHYFRALGEILRKRLGLRGHPLIVVGIDKYAEYLINCLTSSKQSSFDLVALVLPDHYHIKTANQNYNHIEIISSESIEDFLAKYPGCHILITAPQEDLKLIKHSLQELNLICPNILLTSDLIGSSSIWTNGVEICGQLALNVNYKLLDKGRQIIKRITDTLFGLAISIPFLFLFLVIYIAIKLDSNGSAIFKQQRLGQHGNLFEIYKFRTMQANSQREQSGIEAKVAKSTEWTLKQKLHDDPRITRVGKFLRKLSLDELPQFFNVLKGEMSLVGPRPIVEDEVSRYGDSYELYKRVKPGITGLWQVSGRSDLTYVQRVELDTYYVRNWSIWLDILIILKTPAAVLFCRGAI